MRKSRVYQLKMDDEEFEKLHSLANHLGRPASEIIRQRLFEPTNPIDDMKITPVTYSVPDPPKPTDDPKFDRIVKELMDSGSSEIVAKLAAKQKVKK